MFFQSIITPGLSLNTYILGSYKSKSCVVIDPPRQITACVLAVQNAGLNITHIIETHVHADFISGAIELKHEMEEKPLICCSGMGGKEWNPSYADRIMKDGEIIRLESIRLQALHTPGHSPEHLSWVCYDEARSRDIPCFAFTGDFLFVGGVGRPDLMGKEASKRLVAQLYDSLFKKMNSFPDFMEIFPAHFNGSLCGSFYEGKNSSTLGFERLCNPYLKACNEQEWTRSLIHGFNEHPPHFHSIKKMNLAGPALLETLTTISSEGGLDEMDLDELFIIDTRLPQKFADFHLKGSINIPMHDHFSQWCTWFIPENKDIGIITDDHSRDSQVVNQLRLVGFDEPILLIAFSARLKSHLQGDCFKLLSPAQIVQDKMQMIDVRTLKEWDEGHVANAQHIELNKIETATVQFSLNLPIVTICRSGVRASIATSILKKIGFQNVTCLNGGMQSWSAAGLPIEKNNFLKNY